MIPNKLGDKVFVAGVECRIRYMNSSGTGWAFPTLDDPDEPLVARHIAYARIYADGKVVLL